MNIEKIKKAVLQEVKLLKKHATKEEIAKLDFSQLDPLLKHTCIYGQMTGSCFSDRALELVIKCAKKLFNDIPTPGLGNEIVERDSVIDPIALRNFTALEYWIVKYPKNNHNIIKYIQGDINKLEL